MIFARSWSLLEMSSIPMGEPLKWESYFVGITSCVLLFLLMSFPMVLQLLYLKAFLFLVVLIAVALGYVNGQSWLNSRVGLWTLALAIVSFFFVLEGLIAATPGASKAAFVYVVWPLIYVFWIAGLARKRLLLAVHYTAVGATLFIGVYGCLYLLTQLNILPDLGFVSMLSMGWESEAFGSHEGYTQMQIAGLNSLPFLVPYVMASIATQVDSKERHWFQQFCIWTACILGWIVVLAGGRRALFLLMFLTPLLVLFFRAFQTQSEKQLNKRTVTRFCCLFAISIVLLFVGLSLIYQFDLSTIWDRIVTGFDLSSQTIDEGAIARHEQLLALRKRMARTPFTGSGAWRQRAWFDPIRNHALGV